MGVSTAPGRWPPSSLRSWWADIVGGTVGSLAVLAVPLSLGLLAFSALGGDAARAGLMATFVNCALGGVAYALISRAGMPAAGPSSATALILAGLVAALARDPRLAALGPADVALVVGACALTVSLSGALMVMLAACGLARLARLVPRPVLAGFMNGVSLLILVGQLPLLLGLLPGTALGLDALRRTEPAALLLGLGTVALMLAINLARVRWPAALSALLLGTLASLLLRWLWPTLPIGTTIGASDLVWPGLPPVTALAHPAAWALLADHAGALLTTAAVLALIGSLESLLNLLALDESLSVRHDPRRELQSIGLCNLLCGLLAGLPVVLLRARAVAILHAGGRGARAALAGSLALAVLFVLGAPLLAQLPLPVLGGIMVMIAFGLVDRWSGRQLQQWWRGENPAELRSGLAVMVAVCAMTLWLGFAAGVALGVLLSMVIFIGRMNRSLLRLRCSSAERPSRRLYPENLELRLAPQRSAIELWELEGALFFGNADRLLAQGDALPDRVQVLVIDFKRVGAIDETGAAALAKLGDTLQRRQLRVLLCGLAESGAPQRALAAFGITLPQWPDADRATEAAEAHLLGPLAESTLAARPLANCELLHGLDSEQKDLVAARMRSCRLLGGDVLFRQGDAADGLYVLTFGSVSIIGRKGDATQRYVSISPGMMLGETAMLDGQGRSADAVADVLSQLHHLDTASLQAIEREHPEIASQLHRNIARHLSSRLRSASAAWWAGQG